LLELTSSVRATHRYLILLTTVIAAACDGPQSALVTAGRDAEAIDRLFRVMTVGALLVWAAVIGLALYSIRTRDRYSERAAGIFVIGGGVTLPTVLLAGLLLYGLPTLPAVLALPADSDLKIHVTGKQWWWRVQYLTPNGTIESANELRLPLGRRIELQLESRDVIHSFWVPSIAGKMDMIPGRMTRLALEPTRLGVFRGACAEYCGASHAKMAFEVIVVPASEFAAWLDTQAQPAQPPASAQAMRGQDAFAAHGCTACHTVRGFAAAARIGPDLTHVGSRLRIAASTLGNEPADFADWIARADVLKPGVHMPAFRTLPPGEVAALAAYLDSLQ
jgi:cytochrome c oxidase subunit 2